MFCNRQTSCCFLPLPWSCKASHSSARVCCAVLCCAVLCCAVLGIGHRCKLGRKAPRALAQGLRCNKTLRQLNLAGCKGLDEAGAGAIAAAVARSKVLTALNLAFVKLSSGAVDCLVQVGWCSWWCRQCQHVVSEVSGVLFWCFVLCSVQCPPCGLQVARCVFHARIPLASNVRGGWCCGIGPPGFEGCARRSCCWRAAWTAACWAASVCRLSEQQDTFSQPDIEPNDCYSC
jgi:hypothetical protein